MRVYFDLDYDEAVNLRAHLKQGATDKLILALTEDKPLSTPQMISGKRSTKRRGRKSCVHRRWPMSGCARRISDEAGTPRGNYRW